MKGRFFHPATILVLFVFGGCTASIPHFGKSPSIFPPQKVMEDGDYGEFFAQNQKALKECRGGADCEVALFNLGFACAYPKSPHYNPAEGLRHFEQLIGRYPNSPRAYEARVWVELMKDNMASEDGRRRMQGQLKAKDDAINQLKKQIKRSRDIDVKIDQKERELLQ